MRNEECKELLNSCEKLLKEIGIIVKRKINHNEEKEIFIPEVKSFLEHCRSILDYCALDIFQEVLQKQNIHLKERNVYFPYGNINVFHEELNKKLPNLKNCRSDIYYLLKGVQDFSRKDDRKFLIYMCKLTNTDKHNRLTKFQRKSNKMVGMKGIFLADETSSITFTDCNFDGIPVSNLEVRQGEIIGEIDEALKPLVIKWNDGTFTLPEGNNVIDFLTLCYKEIEGFYMAFYSIM